MEQEQKQPLDTSQLADHIWSAMKLKGHTAADMCREIGISYSTVQDVFGDRRKPYRFKVSTLRKISEYLGISTVKAATLAGMFIEEDFYTNQSVPDQVFQFLNNRFEYAEFAPTALQWESLPPDMRALI